MERRDAPILAYCGAQTCLRTTQHKWSDAEECYVCQNCGSRKNVIQQFHKPPNDWPEMPRGDPNR